MHGSSKAHPTQLQNTQQPLCQHNTQLCILFPNWGHQPAKCGLHRPCIPDQQFVWCPNSEGPAPAQKYPTLQHATSCTCDTCADCGTATHASRWSCKMRLCHCMQRRKFRADARPPCMPVSHWQQVQAPGCKEPRRRGAPWPVLKNRSKHTHAWKQEFSMHSSE